MFGKRLKELRTTSNLSMDKTIELYNKKFDAKMNKSTLSRYENGLQEPLYTVVVNFSKLFNVSVDYLSSDPEYDKEHKMLNTKTVEFMKIFEGLSDSGKDKVIDYAELIRKSEETKK